MSILTNYLGCYIKRALLIIIVSERRQESKFDKMKYEENIVFVTHFCMSPSLTVFLPERF